MSLPDYVQAGRLKCMLYWAVFILLVIIGAVKILLTKLRQERVSRIITAISVIVGITAVLLAYCIYLVVKMKEKNNE